LRRGALLVLNYKSYLSGLGERGVEIARYAELVSKEYGLSVILAVPFTMISVISSKVEIPVFAQHADPLRPGRGTGYVTPAELRVAGARGSLINHSERRVDLASMQASIELLHEEGLEALACADTPRAALAVSMLEPDMVAVEPPELIGTGLSVSKAKPEVVKSSVALLRSRGYDRPILVGAGVSGWEDAYRSVELGADGVLVSSAVMASDSPLDKIREIALGLMLERPPAPSSNQP